MKSFYLIIIVAVFSFSFAQTNDNSTKEPITLDQAVDGLDIPPEIKSLISTQSRCDKKDNLDFCVFPGSGNRQQDVIYYFHGIFGNEKQWLLNSITQKIYKKFLLSEEGSPTIVAISYGPVWLLTPKNTRTYSGLLDYWSTQEFKKFEKQVLPFSVKKRFVFGDSMGGHNGFAFYLKNQRLFKKALLICPAILATSPYESQSIHKRILTDFHGSWTLYTGVMGLMALYYDDGAYRRYAPYEVFSNSVVSKTAVEIIGVSNDMYGFNDVAKSFVKNQQSYSRFLSYEQQSGSHCYPEDTDSLVSKLQ